MTVMVIASKDAIMPFKEVDFFLVEEWEVGNKEMIEMAEHVSRGVLLGWGKFDPIEVGLDGAVAVGGT